ncbi:MAG TPA: glycosyl hydrolase [Symbiobacteriaceae bacterium]|nr:glycosyl hydrolase [Symbiobacteriaceae bacterium]
MACATTRSMLGLLTLSLVVGACAGPGAPRVTEIASVPALAQAPDDSAVIPPPAKAPDSAEVTPPEPPSPAPPEPAAPPIAPKWEYSPLGLSLKLPDGMAADLSLAPAYVRLSAPDLDVKVSRERSPYADMEMYFAEYLNRFVSSPEYRSANKIHDYQEQWTDVGGRRTRIVSFGRVPSPGSPERQNQYLFAYVMTGGPEFYTFFFRTSSLVNQRAVIDSILASFDPIPVKGEAAIEVDFRPELPVWNAETAALYERLRNAGQVQWGIFYPWAVTQDYSRIAAMEASLGYKFPFILHYLYLGHEFPTEGMQRAYARGQVVELTMQVATFNNDSVPRRNLNFDVLDGVKDSEIRAFARSAKAFGHPFLFRLNNEMNTDWSQYSGLLTLSDPDIYIKVWRRIYRIFAEEGVDNAIWIFNPHDRSYPPTHWNDQIAYYPGNGYVHMLGLTGYNNGEYFREVTGERWRSFNEIYEPMVAEYRPLYGKFPWIITEFASSSVGGDKAGWIREMFEEMPRYPEIKVAVWWSYADYDYRPGNESIAGRRYWLDEQPEYLEEFKKGLERQGALQ